MAEPILTALRILGDRVKHVEGDARVLRDRRDRLALQAVDEGHTWRTVAEAAGFANPYLAELKRRRDSRRLARAG